MRKLNISENLRRVMAKRHDLFTIRAEWRGMDATVMWEVNSF
ncbi:hypothetical protein QFZ34_004373 [Phyllobacterium ifriqiyense]|uniref:Uncharacterized protein n=1 Tax=Phyllobacterium ifriqiyense TaxID=314238 RepID=A0ABU0SEX8_9HYPH|nr:hypothetical protein PMI41_04837 [Phyllobacterium sp. YR531]MDQ0999191.1 hypothetical protein [Phyllobacterium ifriqiyense]